MLATSAATAMTLMACYGMPPCDDPQDADQDGYPTCSDDESPEDCDDNNADVHDGANDPEGDGIDQNCDGVDGIYSESGGGGAGGAPAGGAPAGGAPAGGAPAGGAGS